MANLDVRQASYRATYWKETPGSTTGRTSPVRHDMRGKEASRSQDMNREASHRTFAARSPSPATHRFDTTELTRSMSEAGGLRSLPTQISERPANINVNHLRGGQRSYTAKANISNYIEERFDANFRAGTAVSSSRRQYDSMSTSTLREAQATYLTKQRRSMTCKLPAVGAKDFRSRTWQRGNLINYAPQPAAAADPAAPPSLDAAGMYWVGTAPSNMYKSMSATTYGESKKAEFQIRSLGSDGRSRMLKSMKPEHKPDPQVLASYRLQYNGAASARSERRWQSESAAQYTSFLNIAPSLDTRRQVNQACVTDLRNTGVQGGGLFL
uniref:Uncharacterized protein n=1 Tax=Mantoniella antarctica TaxID=81844 RepID=A0A6U3GJY1_9CHLO|mmetsp:Transcript_29141/g.72772  ORF Transcript_29141/g.72772 Transcript_29141/m.72772 type:complete len:326 (+) Transcript_29141:456-1433(+)|eukprot:CAMPEP_0181391462 /NCGR_PEP_ID=MMETSP1106-20121128/26052_1 /TAXON_ID=81844 /ORGANISM="Mantoniella antarctica, Strain SL-175" /LENGTH=325 /DNA_ID=CAMNT_0023512483 /DNA_START=393 /DNA_END=1370 /DNA_ORIENTATION=+